MSTEFVAKTNRQLHAYHEGVSARREGFGTNPYTMVPSVAKAWNAGWWAEDQRQREVADKPLALQVSHA
jgi:hypothetical protein